LETLEGSAGVESSSAGELLAFLSEGLDSSFVTLVLSGMPDVDTFSFSGMEAVVSEPDISPASLGRGELLAKVSLYESSPSKTGNS